MSHYENYKKFKKKYILKYKNQISRTSNGKILDSFISINDFLAVEMSKGPNELPGKINYFYQEYRNIYNFFTILVNYYNFDEILCIPNFVLKHKRYIDTTAIIYFYDTNDLIVPVKIIEKIKKCMKSDTRFIYFSFIIDKKTENSISHANIVIIDLHKKTIERFEPYGYIRKVNNEIHPIDVIFENKLLKILELTDFKYLAPFDISPKIGLQFKADAYGGMCVTFTMLYLQLRIMNPDIIQNELINYLLKKSKKELITLVLRYAKFVEITLKKYDYQIYTHNKYVEKKWYSKQDYIIYNGQKDVVIQL
jgi:hypothetical protein